LSSNDSFPRRRMDLAILVGLDTPAGSREMSTEDSLAELAQLADTAGLQVVEILSQKRPSPDRATYVGEGKVALLAERLEATGAGGVIVDDELSGTQLRNLEEALGVDVVDRTQLILDIFARRAHTREGKLQVELAQLSYRLPRLSGHGKEMSRLGGGIGTRGPGETTLEVDRRTIRSRIATLKRDLEAVRTHRRLHRESRRGVPLPVVAIAGYTNAGKSTLFAALTGAEVFIEDKLFATLDPTTRKVALPGGHEILLTDTVGFIRKLPHNLVAAFRATLEEVLEADLILNITDVSHRLWRDQLDATRRVLEEIGAGQHPSLHVLNKLDMLPPEVAQTLPGALPVDLGNPVVISALRGTGLDVLKERISTELAGRYETVSCMVPFDRSDLVSLAHARGRVLAKEHTADGVSLTVVLPSSWAARLKSALRAGRGGEEGSGGRPQP
jgi:GTP-binding protein HflX